MTDIQSKSALQRTNGDAPQGPHWSPLQELDALELGRHTHDSLDELLGEVAVTSIPMAIRAEILSSGLNVALQRWPQISVEPLNMPKAAGLMPTWKPTRQKIVTFGLQFPEGASLIAKQEADAKKAQLATGEAPDLGPPPIEILPDDTPRHRGRICVCSTGNLLGDAHQSPRLINGGFLVGAKPRGGFRFVHGQTFW